MKLIEWLGGEKAQQMYADMNHEYPLRDGVAVNPIIASYGKLKPDSLPLAKIAHFKKAAATLVDKVGFNN
jgi:iron(III) transport system substrate-binding protein